MLPGLPKSETKMKADLSPSEIQVGARCFANTVPGMKGIIKARYSDFHVHEIDKNGNVIYLKSIGISPEPSYPPGFEEWIQSHSIFFSFRPESDQQVAMIYLDHPDISVHVVEGEVQLEKVFKSRVRPAYTSFVVCKENIGEQEVIDRIASKINAEKKEIGYAGNKDKRGITTQVMTVRGATPQVIYSISRSFQNFRIGQICRAMEPITLGDNSGNRFTIVLRGISVDGSTEIQKSVSEKVDALKKSGFLNYYGMQRFGTCSIPTHEYGKLILRQEWRQLIDMILTPQRGESERIHEAKLLYKRNHDPIEARRMTPPGSAENSVFNAIAKLPPGTEMANPLKVFQCIDRRLRMMYIHAYQSYLWNNAVSARWEKNGPKVVVGDKAVDLIGAIVDVTQQNINNFSIFDVVIPLPSSKTVPKEIADIMAKDGITTDMFEQLASEYSAQGDWRRIIAVPKDVEWEIVRHNDMEAPLIDSDIEKIDGKTNLTNRDDNGKISSLVISFSLSTGQYATMCLRELLKRSTEWWTDAAMGEEKSLCSRICIVQ